MFVFYSLYFVFNIFFLILGEIVARREPYPELDPVQVALKVVNPNQPLRLVPPPHCPPILCEIMELTFQTIPEKRGDFNYILGRLGKAQEQDWLPIQQAQFNSRPVSQSPKSHPFLQPQVGPRPVSCEPSISRQQQYQAPTGVESVTDTATTYAQMPDFHLRNK